MTFIYVMSSIIVAGITATIYFFRRGGIYNPIMPSTDHLTEITLETPSPTPVESIPSQNPAPTAPQSPKVSLATFCGYIRDFEGKPGALNYQLNNPGDCRPSPVGYLPKYEPVEIIDTDTDPRYLYHKGKFAKFPTYELGWEYLVNMVHFTATNHPTWTIIDFFSHYAPSKDKNDPIGYAKNIAKRCGTTVDIQLKDLLV